MLCLVEIIAMLFPICVVYDHIDLGWRKFMEDATLYVSPFTYKNFSLFGVFDGHGGNNYIKIGP